ISEEMSALALGKRTLQFISNVPQEHWFDLAACMDEEIEEYAANHKDCVIVESCGTVYNVATTVERLVREKGVRAVGVDYAQLLRAFGKSRYEQVTNTSVILRQLASSQKIIMLVLCQLSREIESRNKFVPQMSDLKDTGQLEQDADVISFLVWPHKIDSAEPRNKFQFFIAKNRNRAINQNAIECRFIPEKQKFLESAI